MPAHAPDRRAKDKRAIATGLPAQGKKNEPPGGGSGVNREASNGVDRIHSDPENWMKRIVQLIG
jgi:hypothetical protein